MKPLRLQMQAFGPYAGCECVDFEKLAQQGMFLITGPTGSGKTTIFDAMTFALYGGSSGDDSKTKTGRNDLEQWRCNQADKTAKTIVCFTFRVQERTYQFARMLVPKRKNLSAEYTAGELDENGVLIPFFENPKEKDLNAKAVALIGLTKEQFRQVVLLPQGQFERFLTASSDEKEDILKKIFEADRWDGYAKHFYDAADARKKALDSELADIQRALAEEGAADFEELDSRIAARKEKKKASEAACKAFNPQGKQRQLNADRELAERFQPLHRARRTLAELQLRQGEMEQKRARYGQATRAEQLRDVVSDYEKAEKECAARRRAWQSLDAQLPAVDQAHQQALAALLAHGAASPVLEHKARITVYESKRSLYQTLHQLQKDLADGERQFRAQQKNTEKAEAEADKACQEAADRFRQCGAAEGHAGELRQRYYAGIYGEIAAQLAEDAPCPVCGSIHHPAPAARTADSVTKAALEAAEMAEQNAKKAWRAAEVRRETAEQTAQAWKDRLYDAQKRLDAAKAALDHAQADLIEDIPSGELLEKRIRELQEEIARYQGRSAVLQAESEKTKERMDKLTAQIDAADRERRAAEKRLEEAGAALGTALAQSGYENRRQVEQALLADAERQSLYAQLVAYDQQVQTAAQDAAEQQQRLAGLQEPDVSRFEARQQQIDQERSRYDRENSVLQAEIARLTEKSASLRKKQAHYDSRIQQAKNDQEFAKKLRGDSGIGLQRYVLAILFNQVIGEANRMLEKVHAGRYHLYRTDDRGAGKKRGLELKVRDSRSPETEGRSVAMLSGGEKFLVSLSLSIGLSTVAQKTGVQIEALFIDEGFGTLDDSSIHDAMDILESVRRSSGMIGIISHVQLLESTIPTHLTVKKTAAGSTIVQC